jgi:uncharacterized protein (TIGR02391 family)
MNKSKEDAGLIKIFQQKFAAKLEKCARLSEKLSDNCSKLSRSWSGSFAGWHGNMYFRDFEIPSIHQKFSGEWGGIHGILSGWEEKQPEQVSAKLGELVGNGFSIDQLESDIKSFRQEVETLQREIVISYAAFSFNADMSKEKELCEKVENYSFGASKNEFIRARLPESLMSRDSEAIRQGMCTPAWLYYEGIALEGISLCKAINDFFILIDRLSRQLENKTKAKKQDCVIDFGKNLNADIYTKCHELYEKGAYAEAVEKSFKVVRDRLRKLTGYETGSEAFGKGKLHIKGAAASNVDQDFNNAVKFLTMAIDQFRNEKSHTSDAKIDDPIRAYEYLRLSSLAMNLLENTEIVP